MVEIYSPYQRPVIVEVSSSRTIPPHVIHFSFHRPKTERTRYGIDTHDSLQALEVHIPAGCAGPSALLRTCRRGDCFNAGHGSKPVGQVVEAKTLVRSYRTLSTTRWAVARSSLSRCEEFGHKDVWQGVSDSTSCNGSIAAMDL